MGRATPRIVSLLPSGTECLAAINAAGMLVGRSHECDWPSEIAGLPALTGAAVHDPRDGVPDPAAVDAAVRASLAAGKSLYTLDVDRLAALEPDVIITQDLCAVCSIDLGTVRAVAGSLPRPAQVVSLNPASIEDVFDDMLMLGNVIGLESQARRAVVTLRERFFRAAEYVNPFDDGPGVAFLEWTDPLFVGGHWTPQLIERAGGRHPLNPTVAAPESGAAAGPQAAQRRAGKSITVSPEILVSSAPQAVIICPCGIDLAGSLACAAALRRQPWWPQLPAARTGRVAVVDGNQMFNRPGPRLVDAFEWLVGWLNERPELTPPSFPWSGPLGPMSP